MRAKLSARMRRAVLGDRPRWLRGSCPLHVTARGHHATIHPRRVWLLPMISVVSMLTPSVVRSPSVVSRACIPGR